MLRASFAFFRRLLIYGAYFLCVPVMVIGASFLWRVFVGDPLYASQVFDGELAYDEVLASRAWNRRFGAWDCTYAVVSLNPDIETFPPGSPTSEAHWKSKWGGAWRVTPAEELGDTTRDALGYCSQYFESSLAQQLFTAMAVPGSYYVRDQIGETVSIYSAPQRIAVRIRFGD